MLVSKIGGNCDLYRTFPGLGFEETSSSSEETAAIAASTAFSNISITFLYRIFYGVQ